MAVIRKRIYNLIIYGNYLLENSFTEYEFKLFENDIISLKDTLMESNLFEEYVHLLKSFNPTEYKINFNNFTLYLWLSFNYSSFNFYLTNKDTHIAKRYIIDMVANLYQMINKHQ